MKRPREDEPRDVPSADAGAALRTGCIKKAGDKFGFIQPDDGEEELFVLPGSCEAFGSSIPPQGTKVIYRIVIDGKTGRPRAEDVISEVEQFRGTVDKVLGNYGFIQQDDGERMFVTPLACNSFGNRIPPPGTRVQFQVVTDQKTGKPRAEYVQPAEDAMGLHPAMQVPAMMSPRASYSTAAATGTVAKINEKGTFGFIVSDRDGEEMFFMPKGCFGFGGVMPDIGTRVSYDIVADEKTGRPRADNIMPDQGPALGTSRKGGFPKGLHSVGQGIGKGSKSSDAKLQPAAVSPNIAEASARHSRSQGVGVIDMVRQGYGLILQDSTGEEILVMPSSCEAFGGAIPAPGTRVCYDIVTDAKTGKLRAENVQPEEHAMPKAGFRAAPKASSPNKVLGDVSVEVSGGQRFAGTIEKSGPQFGFIKQDSDQEPMFVLPNSCGGEIPPIGTRVTYEIVMDTKTGRPRAESIGPERVAPVASQSTPEELFVGTVVQVGPTYGFLQPDSGGEKMFVLPGSCQAFGDIGIPKEGTRVVYSVVVDRKTGKPRADNVKPEAFLSTPRRGTVRKTGGKFGFIDQDSGEDSMFVMPAACAAFGGVIPPPGTRVIFTTTVDSKTQKPRAEEVFPEGAMNL